MSEAEWFCPKCERSNGSWRAACHCCGYRLPQAGGWVSGKAKYPLADDDPDAQWLAGLAFFVCTAAGFVPSYLLFGINFSTPMPEPEISILGRWAVGGRFAGFFIGLLLASNIIRHFPRRPDPIQPASGEDEEVELLRNA